MKELSETCTEVENSLPLWVGGDLEPAAQRDVDAHLARCTRCAEKAKDARISRERLKQGLDLEQRTIGAGPDPWPAIRAALVAEGRLAGRPARVVRAPRTGLPIRAAAAAGIVFALAFAWTRFSSAPSTPPQTAGTIPGVERGPAPAPTQVDVVPAVAGSGLRPLKPGERQLRDTAQFFFDPVNYENGSVSPVGLQGAPAVPPR